MLFYRQKLLLALLQAFGGELEKIRLQKLLFLLNCEQSEKTYDFIPYHYGCYSYTANKDLVSMRQKNIVSETENSVSIKLHKENYADCLKETDINALKKIKYEFEKMSISDLMKYTYVNYPYWAIKSKTKNELLKYEELQNVNNFIPQQSEIVLFTIGYEGISLEEYFNRLIRNNIRVLVDVRSNAYSMKYGFSKKNLGNICRNFEIEYIHLPEVGIISEKRQTLNISKDYENLFYEYRNTVLLKTQNTQNQILQLLKSKRRIALTCFEKDINCCHRKHLANSISKLPQFSYKVEHI